MVKVVKLFGENPEKVHVLDTAVEFDAEGVAEVSTEIAEVFGQIPGYEVTDEFQTAESVEEPEESPSEEDAEETEEEAPKPKRPARKAPTKK